MAEALGVAAAILQITGMGAKLSITIHKLGVQVATAGSQLAGIARGISLFSLTLKQVGKSLEEHDSIHSPGAIESTKEVIEHGRYIYSQIQKMVDDIQSRHTDGSAASMNLGKKIKFCFKKTKIDSLLGELDSLKMTLSTMLQVFYTGKLMAMLKKLEDLGTVAEKELEAKEDEIEQEEDEIRSLVLTRHWALVRLSQLHSDETHDESKLYYAIDQPQSPSPRASNALIHPGNNHSEQTLTVYTEESLHSLDSSLSSVSDQPHELMLRSRDFVEYLLEKWTIIREIEAGERQWTDAGSKNKANAYDSFMEDVLSQKINEAFQKAYQKAEAQRSPRMRNRARAKYDGSDSEEYSSETETEEISREDQNHQSGRNVNRKSSRKEGLGIRWWRGSDITNTRRSFIDKSLKSFKTPDKMTSSVSRASFGQDQWTQIPDFWVCREALRAWDYDFSSYEKDTGKTVEDKESGTKCQVTETVHQISEPLTFDEVEDLVELSAAIRDRRGSRLRVPLAKLVPRRTNTIDDMPYPNAPFGKLGHIAEGILKEGKKWRPADDNKMKGSQFSRRQEGTAGSTSLLMHMIESKFGEKMPSEIMDHLRGYSKVKAVSGLEP